MNIGAKQNRQNIYKTNDKIPNNTISKNKITQKSKILYKKPYCINNTKLIQMIPI